jgi:hypothetical protein
MLASLGSAEVFETGPELQLDCKKASRRATLVRVKPPPGSTMIASVNPGFPRAQRVEIGSVEYQNFQRRPRALTLPAPYLGHDSKFAVDARNCPGLEGFSERRSGRSSKGW